MTIKKLFLLSYLLTMNLLLQCSTEEKNQRTSHEELVCIIENFERTREEDCEKAERKNTINAINAFKLSYFLKNLGTSAQLEEISIRSQSLSHILYLTVSFPKSPNQNFTIERECNPDSKESLFSRLSTITPTEISRIIAENTTIPHHSKKDADKIIHALASGSIDYYRKRDDRPSMNHAGQLTYYDMQKIDIQTYK